MATVYIMCGLAFSGKSTVARKIAEFLQCKIVAFDTLWIDIDNERPIPKDGHGWRLVRQCARAEVAKELQAGRTVVYDDNNIRFEHREQLRAVARRCGAGAVVVYLNTPMELIRAREAVNRLTGDRHEVEPHNFNAVLEQLQIPGVEERVLAFRPEMNLNEWVMHNCKEPM